MKETRDRLSLAYPGLDVRDEKELRDVAIGIFEQTFQATHALSVIGLVVAFAGLLLLGLLSIFDESTQTWQTLKHLGFSTSTLYSFGRIGRRRDRIGRMGYPG